jgi:hypothetical protein
LRAEAATTSLLLIEDHRDIDERRPEYARYIRDTNAFFPGKHS